MTTLKPAHESIIVDGVLRYPETGLNVLLDGGTIKIILRLASLFSKTRDDEADMRLSGIMAYRLGSGVEFGGCCNLIGSGATVPGIAPGASQGSRGTASR